jgi:hypothetical protein
MVPAPSPRFRRPRRRSCRGTACRPPAFPLVTTRVGQALPLRRADSEKSDERTGNVDENKGRLSTTDRQLEDLGHGAALVLCFLNPKPRSKCPFSWHGPASLPIPSPPWGRGWTATAFSSATAGRMRGWFRSTQTFFPSFLSCSSESWRASPFRRNCGAVNSSAHSRRGQNPSPVRLRLMTPPEPDARRRGGPRRRPHCRSGRPQGVPLPRRLASLHPRLAQTCFPRSVPMGLRPAKAHEKGVGL